MSDAFGESMHALRKKVTVCSHLGIQPKLFMFLCGNPFDVVLLKFSSRSKQKVSLSGHFLRETVEHEACVPQRPRLLWIAIVKSPEAPTFLGL